MKKLFVLPIILLLSLFIISCEDTTTGPDGTTPTTGNLFIQSTPAGAQIWYGKGAATPINSGKVTPDTIKSLDAAAYTVILKIDGFKDSAFTMNVTAGQTTSKAVALNSNLLSFAGAQIWESLAPDPVTQPSGLILKSGTNSGVGSSAPNRLLVDLGYYSSASTFKLRSAHLWSGLTRQLFFKAASGSNINDAVNSPVKDGTWVSELPNGSDRDSTKYYFVYDQDKHYSKIKVVGWGGGTGGTDYAWTRIQVIYNSDVDDIRF